MVEQGDIIRVPNIDFPLLVISRTLYNKTGKALVCPIVRNAGDATLTVEIDTASVSGFVCCDNPKRLDLASRGYSPKGRIPLAQLIVVLDMVQSLIDYI